EQLRPHAVSLPPWPDRDAPGEAIGPVGYVRLSDTILATLDELDQILPPTEFRASLLDALRQAYQPGRTMSEAFGRWMERVLGHRGLVVYDSSDPASKPLASQVFQRELSMPGETVKLATLAGSDLVARGYHAQVHSQENSLALFHLDDDHRGRQPIRQQDGR